MNLRIDRLTLRLSGVSEGDARRLAALIAQNLAAADAPRGAVARSELRVSVAAELGESIDGTARRVVDQLLYALERSS